MRTPVPVRGVGLWIGLLCVLPGAKEARSLTLEGPGSPGSPQWARPASEPDGTAAPEPDTLAAAETGGDPDSTSVVPVRGINVTATRERREVFLTPAPTAVLGPELLRRRSGTEVADLFPELPGLDREGVGGNQRRPVIRGLGGQRVLLLEDGVRLNNPRRRLDSGEPPALAGRSDLQRVEVVRGPTSVLYGSDALGGVVNLVAEEPPLGPGAGFGGSVSAAYGSADEARRASGALSGRAGPLGFRVSGGYRTSDAYRAPSGSFGDVTLEEDAPVHGTGVSDLDGSLDLGLRVGAGQRVLVGYDAYRAEDAGFGYLDPSLLGEGLPTVDISFPDQTFRRYTARYQGSGLNLRWADRMEIALYGQSNDRDFRTRVWSPMGGSAPPGAGVEVLSMNRSELETRGIRLEAGKLLGQDLLLKYGVELHRDRSTGSDSSTVTVLGLGPPSVRGSGVSRVPDARLWSLGVFAQTRLAVASRTELVLGGRYQEVTARVLGVEEEGVPDEAGDRTVVGAASVLHRPHPRVAVVASASRGFRSPNLVERFFTGPTPEGSGVWIRNPDLGAETSLNIDLGLRLRLPRVTGELFLFRNALADGVRLEATGDSIGGLPAYRNVNVSRLRIRGLEAYVDVELGRGLAAGGGFTALRCRNPDDPEDGVSEACGDRANGSVRWSPSGAPVWAEYAIRWSGERGDALPEASPVGPRIPSFLVQDLRAGLRVAEGYRISVALRNLGDVLYAESTNAGFFRPEPGRSLVVGVSASF